MCAKMGKQTTLKKQILEACIAEVERTMANYKAAMDDAQQQANDYGQPKDRYDSFRAQMMRRRDMFAQQFQKARNDLAVFQKINHEENKNIVEFGAFVKTDLQNLFITAGIGKVMMGDMSWFAVSTVVPVFLVMKGKKAGDEVSFNGRVIRILEVF